MSIMSDLKTKKDTRLLGIHFNVNYKKKMTA